jgi:hypothetical protein
VLYQLSYSRTTVASSAAHVLLPRPATDGATSVKHLLTAGPVEVRGIEPLTS